MELAAAQYGAFIKKLIYLIKPPEIVLYIIGAFVIFSPGAKVQRKVPIKYRMQVQNIGTIFAHQQEGKQIQESLSRDMKAIQILCQSIFDSFENPPLVALYDTRYAK